MFICFDIIEFYPSITEKLLNDALDLASQYTEISPLDRKTIIHTKKTLLFHQNQPWVKKDKPFDVVMGSYDGAVCCELIVIYLLSQLKQNYGNAIGLYDGTPPNPSTIDVMVGSPSKKQMRARDMLQSFGNLFLVRLVAYYEFERV